MLELGENERLIKDIRKHWYVIARANAPYVLGIFIPFIIYSYITGGAEIPIGPTTTLAFNTSTAIAIFWGALWILLMWTKMFHVWTDYYLDKMIITNEKVIDIDQKGFFKRETSVFRMDKIQDVTMVTSGIFGTFLNYGCIFIQTAGSSEKFTMRAVPNPAMVRDMILEHQDIALQNSEPTL